MAKGTFGERLKREREMREVSLNEVTVATRIGPRLLEALENEDWAKLPGGVFNRGYVRAIAQFLGLDPENLLAEYDLAHGEKPKAAPAPYENKLPSPPMWIPALAILLLIGALAGMFYAGRYVWHRRQAEKTGGAVAGALAGGTSTATPPEANSRNSNGVEQSINSTPANRVEGASSGLLDLYVSTSAATRMRIVADGTAVVDAEVPAGENRHFKASDKFEVSADDSSAVFLELNGKAMAPVGLPGMPGTVTLDRSSLRGANSGSAAQP